MANPNAATGLTPKRLRNGSPWGGPGRTYWRPATDANPLYIGDPVVITAGSDTVNGAPSVVRATAGGTNRITGVVVGFRPSAPFTPQNFLAASVAGYVIVADEPDLLLEVQESATTDGAALTAAAMGKNVNLVAGTGNNLSGSGFMIDSTTAATTATLQCRIIQLQHYPNNSFGAYAKWLVAINLPTETGAAGSLGV